MWWRHKVQGTESWGSGTRLQHRDGFFKGYCDRALTSVDTVLGSAAVALSAVQLAAAQEQLVAAGQVLGAVVQLLLLLCK